MIDRFEHFTMDIFSISRSWNRLATGEMKKYGLRGAYALYLVMIGSSEGQMTAARLAELCQRDKADVSRAIAAFQKEGILDPYNGARYRAPLRLTEKGKTLAEQISRRASEVIEQAGQGISAEMSENMYRCLDIIAGNMREICENGE
jgi:DNA-binding MarR family transcriptional regulator